MDLVWHEVILRLQLRRQEPTRPNIVNMASELLSDMLRQKEAGEAVEDANWWYRILCLRNITDGLTL